MGNTYFQNKNYYQNSGQIHVKELGALMDYSHEWPGPSVGSEDYKGYKGLGRWFCDHHGIPRQGDWCKLGDTQPKLFEDVSHYYLN